MSDKKAEPLRGLDGASYRELKLLEEVERTPQVSQRHLAAQLGIALGVANLLVRNLVKRGYLRASQIGWKRWVYVVTPAGFARKVQLTLDYVDRFLGHYKRVRALLREDLETLTLHAESRVAIYGTTDLAELMYLALRERGVTEVDFIDSGRTSAFLGLPVKSLDSINAGDYDRLVLLFPSNVEARCRELEERGFSPSVIVAPLQNSARKHGRAGRSDMKADE